MYDESDYTSSPDFQYFSINQDGTISYAKNSELVLGVTGQEEVIKFVKKGDADQLIFDEAAQYLMQLKAQNLIESNNAK